MTSTTLYVRAARAGCPVYRPGPRRLGEDGREATAIYSDAPVRVPNEPFYRRRIAAGDLVLVIEEAKQP
jgi:hypothetical protein